MQLTEQATDQAEQVERRAGQFVQGKSGNPRGRESASARIARRDAIVDQWAESIGGIASLKPAELHLLRKAADLDMLKPSGNEDAVRIANTITKIMVQVGLVDRRGKQREPARALSMRDRLQLEAEATAEPGDEPGIPEEVRRP
jgi:uncharacterized protein related to proFAR isomerase